MREILFRGKRIDTSEWAIGGFNKIEEKCFIINEENTPIEVIPQTVGQHVGIQYENDEKVFEGDLLKIPSTNQEVHGAFTIQEVMFRNGTWIVEYLYSEKGQPIPPRYAGGELLGITDYTTKDIIDFERGIVLWDIEHFGNVHDDYKK